MKYFYLLAVSAGLFLTVNYSHAASPIGHVDEISSDGFIKGWAADRDALGWHLEVHAYFDGPVGRGRYVTGNSTKLSRCDVKLTTNDCGFGYGYEIPIPVQLKDGKPHSVYVYAVGVNFSSANGYYKDGNNSLLIGSPKRFTLSQATDNKKPIGHVDYIKDPFIFGWGLDPDHTDKLVALHFYFDGPAGVSSKMRDGTTGHSRSDINALGYSGHHGYAVEIPHDLRDGQTHTVYVYAIDMDDALGQSNVLLGTKSFNIGVAGTPPVQRLLQVTVPNGSEIWGQGTTQKINWTDDGFDANSDSYEIYVTDGYSTYQIGGSFKVKEMQWKVGTAFGATVAPGSNYRVEVVAIGRGMTVSDRSDGVFTVTAAPTDIKLTTTSMPETSAGTDYSLQFQATGGTKPYRWEMYTTDHPCCFTQLDSATGLFSNISSAARPLRGYWTIGIRVVDANGYSSQNLYYWNVR